MRGGELALHPLSTMWWLGKRKDVLPFLPLATSGRGEVTLPFTICRTKDNGPVPCQGQQSWPWECHHERLCPTRHLPYGGMGKGEKLPSPCPLKPVISGRAVPEVTRGKGLALPLTSCSTWQSGPYTLTWQDSRAGPGVVGVGKTTQRLWGRRISTSPWLLLRVNLLGQFHPGIEDEGELAHNQPSSHPDRELELWVGPSQHLSRLWSARAHEGLGPTYPKLWDLHDTGQQDT